VSLTDTLRKTMILNMDSRVKKKTVRTLLIGLTVICFVILVYLLVFLRLSGFWTTNYYTTIYFSPVKFREIMAGMTRQEVRDIAGPPFHRRRMTSACYWIYSLPLRPEKAYKKFEVVFDNDSKEVIRSSMTIDRLSWDPKTEQWIELSSPKPTSPWKISHFDYQMIQGEAPNIEGKSQNAYLIQIMATWCGPCSKGRVRIEKLLREDLSDIPIQLLLISVDESRRILREYLDNNQITTPVAWDPNNELSEPMSEKLIPRYLVLKGKTLYPFEFAHYTGESEEYYDDLAWFIRCYANIVPGQKNEDAILPSN